MYSIFGKFYSPQFYTMVVLHYGTMPLLSAIDQIPVLTLGDYVIKQIVTAKSDIMELTSPSEASDVSAIMTRAKRGL